DGIELEDVDAGVLAYRRGPSHLVMLNLADEPRPAPRAGPIVRATHAARLPAGSRSPDRLAPGEGCVALLP
ncbi:MAG TPA: hypothetical protein VF715_11000, partial [Thermoleophilaceae bacterium]